MQCAESLRVQAYFDGEVDALSAAEIERHIEHCGECRALLQDLEKVRAALREGVTYAAAPQALRTQILQALEQRMLPKEAPLLGPRQRTLARVPGLARTLLLDGRVQRHRRRRARGNHRLFRGHAGRQSFEQ